jgi:phospholipid-binding lipoprotein MlaA
MSRLRYVPVLWLIAMTAGLSACGGTPTLKEAPETPESAATAPPTPTASPTPQTVGSGDPFEGFNRVMYSFNDKLDRYVLKPVAKGYRAVTPDVVRRGITNFFSNLHEPIIIVNDALQGKFRQAASDTGRFLSNSTVGLVGLFDVATSFGLPKHDEDFGQTLGVWGVGEGAYLVLPFFGPSSIRDGVGLVADYETYPPSYLHSGPRDKLGLVEVVNKRARLLDASDILEQAGGEDPYVFLREFYRQQRRNAIYDGNPPQTQSDKSLLFEDDTPAPPAKPAEPDRNSP